MPAKLDLVFHKGAMLKPFSSKRDRDYHLGHVYY